MRDQAEHVWPEFSIAFFTPVDTALSNTASSRMTQADLPPSSSVTFFTVAAATLATRVLARAPSR